MFNQESDYDIGTYSAQIDLSGTSVRIVYTRSGIIVYHDYPDTDTLREVGEWMLKTADLIDEERQQSIQGSSPLFD